MIEDLTACFDGLADPRVIRQCDHRLIDILVTLLSGFGVVRLGPGPGAKEAWCASASGDN